MYKMEGAQAAESLLAAVLEILAKDLPAVLVYQRPIDMDSAATETRVAATDPEYLLYAAKASISAHMCAKKAPAANTYDDDEEDDDGD